MNRTLHYTAFAVGLAALGWVAAGYVGSPGLALALVLAIAAFYLAGAWELQRLRRDTDGLCQALDLGSEPPASLETWLSTVPGSLQQVVRLRVQGERVALPGPALTPYLAGLLVLLGMLGTFLGMVVTLKGTGLALEQASDVDAIRASLAAPVKGLGLAFGSSVAGVAASAMLGLMSALARRERQRAGQALDARIAGPLRAFSRARQREDALQLAQRQAAMSAEWMPQLVTQIQALVTQFDRQGQALHERLSEGQTGFHDEAQRAYRELATSVDQSLRTGLLEGARQAGAVMEPAVQATMAGLARETVAVHAALDQAVQRQQAQLGEVLQRQLDGLAAQVAGQSQLLADRWQAALAEQQRHGLALTRDLQDSLGRFEQGFAQRTTALVDGVAARLDGSTVQWAAAWDEALSRQRQAQDALSAHTRETLTATVTGFAQHAESLLQRVAEAQATRDAQAAEQDHRRQQDLQQGLAALSARWQQDQRAAVEALSARQQQICDTLEVTASRIAAQAEAHARATMDEIGSLVQAAAEAPRAAAEVIGELRGALSDSLVRDNAVLDERQRLLATLAQLLDAVNHASTEQRSAIDALVQATATMLERAGARFGETVAQESLALQSASAQLAAGAAEVASLSEGLGAAVRQFGQASEQLTGQLQRIESALGQSMARSDEQLAYYVAQAREIIDLTLGSHQRIVEDLQRLGAPPAARTRSAGGTAARPAAEAGIA